MDHSAFGKHNIIEFQKRSNNDLSSSDLTFGYQTASFFISLLNCRLNDV